MPPPKPTSNGVAANGNGAKVSKSRNQLKREKKKAKKQAGGGDTDVESSTAGAETETETETESEMETDIEGEIANFIDMNDPALSAFSSIFQKFQVPDSGSEGGINGDSGPVKGEVIYSDEEEMDEEDLENEEAKMSKKKQKKMARLTVADLKTLVSHPEIVEWTDPTARDPRLLVELKSYRNVVPVPAHWASKRDYLQGKRGVEKAPFQLPAYIVDTGIATQRDAIKEKEAGQSLKQKTRERVQPKMGKIDIDYQKLHDAFFRFQTKPKMTTFGEVYYEGKELEADVKEKRPGELSAELVEALSIPPLAPPPWLISMQRFGPPPSYASLRIPGLNAPIPNGAQWGFHPGGWGKPPVDDLGRPLYGDVFGVHQATDGGQYDEPISSELFGELDPEEEESEEEDEEEEEEEEEDEEEQAGPGDPGLQTPSGLETPSGTQSIVSTVPGGLETPDFMDLRKRTGTETEESTGRRELYTVIQERETNVRGFMGSERGYDVGGIGMAAPQVLDANDRGSKRKAGTVEVSIDAAELEGLSKEELQKKYDEQRSQSSAKLVQSTSEDFSDLHAENAAKNKRARGNDRDDRGRRDGGGRSGGREKEKYKF